MGQENAFGGVQEAIWWTEAMQIRAGMHLPIATSFHYTSSDPYAARITFHPDPDNVPGLTWCVERDLLSAGTCARAGAGDVQTWPAPGPSGACYTLLQIGPSAGRAVFRIDTAALREWLALTYSLVPPGTETGHLDWEPFERLLADQT